MAIIPAMAHLHSWINLFWQIRYVDDLPEMSNAALVFVGVILYFQRYIGWVEQHPKFRDFLCGSCLILAAGGSFVSVHQRHEAETEMTGLVGNTNTLIDNTKTLVADTEKDLSNTGAIRQNVDILTPVITSTSSRITELKAEIASSPNPAEVAKLKADLAAKESLLTSTAQEIVSEMIMWTNKFTNDDNAIDSINLREKQDAVIEARRTGSHGIALGAMTEEMNRLKAEETRNNAMQVSDLIKHANTLREQLLKGSEMTPDDYNNQAIFSNLLAGQPLTFREMLDITRYMQALVQRKLPDSVNH